MVLSASMMRTLLCFAVATLGMALGATARNTPAKGASKKPAVAHARKTQTKAAAGTQTARKQPTATHAAKQGAAKHSGARGAPAGAAKAGARTAASKRSATAAARRRRAAIRTWQTRQQQPSPERIRDIQDALIKRGYMQGEADGTWGTSTTEALKRFQQDQNITADGKLSSLSIIGLGLGPKRTAAAAVRPPAAPNDAPAGAVAAPTEPSPPGDGPAQQ